MNRREFGHLAMGASLACGLEQNRMLALPDTLKPKLSVMMWILGAQASPLDQLETIARAGYSAVELVSVAMKWDTAFRKSFVASLRANGIAVDSLAPGGGDLANPDSTAAVVDLMKASVHLADELGCRQFILTPNSRVDGQSQETKQRVIADTLQRVADVLAPHGMEVLLEPIDALERRDSSVVSVSEAFSIVRNVGRPNVKVLYDFYHEQRGSGNLMEKLDGNLDLVGLVHVANVPGRTAPGTGEVNYAAIFRKLAQMKYDRYIAMEFYPAGDPVASLKRAKAEVESAYARASD